MNQLQFTYYRYYLPIKSLGLIEIMGSESHIKQVNFVEEKEVSLLERKEYSNLPALVMECAYQLDAYFHKKLRNFDLPLSPDGTDFQKQVWNVLQTIPYGKTASYLDIALALGDKNKTRAVGSVNGKNPIAIIIPCHRIIGSNGALTGYAGGIWRKKLLLDMEKTMKQGLLF